MLGRSGSLVLSAVGFLLISTGLAAAAERCHQDLPGTRSITLDAPVTTYRLSGERVIVGWRRSHVCAGTAVWEYRSQARATASTECRRGAVRRFASATTTLAASDRLHTVRVAVSPPGSDAPDRLVVLDRLSGRRLGAWPLLHRPAHVAVYDGVAILASEEREALYAVRLADGRIAQLGVARPGDRPLIGPAGVLYQDDLDRSKRRTAPLERTLKLLPLATVRQELERPFTTMRTYMSYSKPAPTAGRAGQRPAAPPAYYGADPARPFESPSISAISMDGPRVALAVTDPAGRCDYILFWNVMWHYATRLTRASGPTCLPRHAPGGITDVAIAGSRAVWTTTYGGETRVLAASITDCQEWVVARAAGGERVAGLVGDGAILSYALRGETGSKRRLSSVGIVPKLWRGTVIGRTGPVEALAADNDQIGTLVDGGVVRIVSRGGALVAKVDVGPARAIALRPGTLAVLTAHGTVDVYRRGSGRRVASWPAPAGATSLDVHHGIAVVVADRHVHALSLANGRSALLFQAPTRVRAELEGPGAAIQFNTEGRAQLRFVPFASIESRLR